MGEKKKYEREYIALKLIPMSKLVLVFIQQSLLTKKKKQFTWREEVTERVKGKMMRNLRLPSSLNKVHLDSTKNTGEFQPSPMKRRPDSL